MSNAEKYRLCIAGMSGTPYIASVTKQPNVMGMDRRKIPEDEFLHAIVQYTVAKLSEGSDTLQITVNGELEAEIIIRNKSLL